VLVTSGDAPATTAAAAVALAGVTVAFRLAGATAYTAVQDASLTIREGEFVSIVGRPAAENRRSSTLLRDC